MTFTAVLFSNNANERRDAARKPVGQASTLRDAQETPYTVMVHDLSVDGCLVECPRSLALGAAIHIGLPGIGRQAATVIRAEHGRYGCRFASSLSPGAVRTAFSNDPIVDGAFAPLPAPMPPFADPVLEKWHPALRLAILAAATAFSWGGLLHLAR